MAGPLAQRALRAGNQSHDKSFSEAQRLKGRTFLWSLDSSKGTTGPSGLMKTLVGSIPGPKGPGWVDYWPFGPQTMAAPNENCILRFVDTWSLRQGRVIDHMGAS